MAMYFAAAESDVVVDSGKNNSCILNNAIITAQTAYVIIKLETRRHKKNCAQPLISCVSTPSTHMIMDFATLLLPDRGA